LTTAEAIYLRTKALKRTQGGQSRSSTKKNLLRERALGTQDQASDTTPRDAGSEKREGYLYEPEQKR